MEGNYLIVLFKNKKKKRIIKSYFRESVAKKKYKELLDNNKVKFEKTIENATPVNYEIGLLTKNSKIQKSIFITDDLGRNNSAVLEDSEYVFLDLKHYKIEETIFDWQTKDKITIDQLMKIYCSNTDLKNIFTLHNKICIQLNLDINVFSLKDKDESDRLLDEMQNYFIDRNRVDAIFVRDVSSAQRKWLYELLVDKGFDKKRLYRLKTTFSKR
jgi:hypothetical protein